MQEIRMTPEELEGFADRVAIKVEQRLIDRFGFKDEDEAQRLMRHMAESARNATEFWDNFSKNSKEGLWSGWRLFLKTLALLVLGCVLYLLGFTGLADKVLK